MQPAVWYRLTPMLVWLKLYYTAQQSYCTVKAIYKATKHAKAWREHMSKEVTEKDKHADDVREQDLLRKMSRQMTSVSKTYWGR